MNRQIQKNSSNFCANPQNISVHISNNPQNQILFRIIIFRLQQLQTMQKLIIIIPIFFLFFCTVNCDFQVANFPEIANRIKSGDHKAVVTRLTTGNQVTTPQDFFRTFTNVPIVAIGIFIFEMDAGNNLGFTVTVGGVTTTGFTSVITAGADTSINQLFYTYIAVDSNQQFGIFTAYSLPSSILPLTNSNTTFSQSFSPAITPTNTIVTRTFLKDFSLTKFNNSLSIKISSRVKQNTNNEFQIYIETNSTVNSASYYVFWIDKTVLERSQIYFVDAGYAYVQHRVNNFIDFPVQPSVLNYYNFMRGINWIAFNTTAQTLFSVKIDGFPFTTVTSYKYAMADLLHWRQRQCPNTSYYYLQFQTKCYDTCPSGYANDASIMSCQKCDYTCQQCLADGTTCTVCHDFNTTKRLFVNNVSCLCQDGHYDVGNSNYTCQACNYTCETCAGGADRCLTCHTTRDYDNVTRTCPCRIRSYDVGPNNSTCQVCHYTCLTCSSTATTCTSCSPSSNRILVLNSCLCQSTFSQPSPASQTCIPSPSLTCSQNCLTCSTISTNCTGCRNQSQSKRTLINNFCSCISGYESTNNFDSCTEICGDGQRFQLDCDDGNNLNGDGCSSGCQVESGFDCGGVGVSVCVYRLGYEIMVVSINKREDQNVVDMVFRISPPPPPTSTPSLSLSSLSIISSTINRQSGQTTPSSLLSMVVEYRESIIEGTLTRLSLSSINTVSNNFEIKSDNGLALTYYDSTSYYSYRVLIGFVYLYLALWWIGTILAIIATGKIYNDHLIIVAQFMSIIGLAVVAIQGVTKIGAFWLAITQLKYIYAYNLQVSGQYGLFAYFNYGLILFIIPFIVFFVMWMVSKRKLQFRPSQQTRRYTLLQVPLSIYIYFSIYLTFSLLTQLKSSFSSTALSITSIIFGIIWLIFLILLSIFFLLKTDKFPSLRSRMLLGKGPYFYIFGSVWGSIVLVFGYCLVAFINSSVTKYSGLYGCACGIGLAIVGVVVRPYQDNVRVLVNYGLIAVVYFCCFIVQQIQVSEWTAFVIMALLYIHMIYTYTTLSISLYKQNKQKQEMSSQTTSQKQQQEQDNSNEPWKVNELIQPKKIDMDFDTDKEIAESHLKTLKKQQNIGLYSVNQSGLDSRFDTVRRGILEHS